MPFGELIDNSRAYAANSKSLLVIRFTDIVDVHSIEEFEKCERAVADEFGHVSVIILVPLNGKVSQIPPEVKERSMQMVKAMGSRLVGTATVVMGKGLGATLIRAFLAGWNLIASSESPQQSFGSVSAALEWLGKLPRGADAKAVSPKEVLFHFGIDEFGKPSTPHTAAS